MIETVRPGPGGVSRVWLSHSLRTAVAATGSLAAADLLRLPEAYWAAVTAMIIMQSTLGAAWTVSVQRVAGTVVGAVLGAPAATYFSANALVFGVGVVAGGLICAAARLDRSAYRFACITLAIIMFVSHGGSGWLIAWYRFVETSLGIAAGLLITVLWPERD